MPDWTKEWPTELGYYWFYGWTHGYWKVDDPKLHFVQVKRYYAGLAYEVNNQLFSDKSGAGGYWALAETPTLPDIEGGG